MKAQFAIAYPIIIDNEGCHANVDGDHGGKTYKGIAYNFYPNWGGWDIIFNYERINGELGLNECLNIPYLDQLVQSHYWDMWNRYRMGEINSQKVANIFFDFIVLASRPVELMQQILNDMGFAIAIDNIMGSQTIGAINQANPDQLYNAYIAGRVQYHNYRVDNGMVEAKFLPGWISRTMNFETASTTKKVALTAGIALMLVIMIIEANSNTKPNKK